MAGSFAFDILLTVIIAVTGAQVVKTSRDVEEVQGITQSGVLCPLYDIFIQGEKSGSATRKFPGESDKEYTIRMEERREAFKVIHEGHGLLKCEERDR